MGSLSIWHWIIVLLVVMLMFGGRGKISNLMGDFAEGIKAFKKGMAEDKPATPSEPIKTLDHQQAGGETPTPKSETERQTESARS